MNTTNQPTLWSLIFKSSVAHTLTYFLMGILAYNFLNYENSFASGALENYMRPTDSPWVAAGPGLQWIRGIIFALAFYPLRDTFFSKKNGWLILGWVLTALGILSTFGAAPASIEGMIYTNYPTNIFSYVEVVPQAFLFAGLLYYWINHPEKKWLNWMLGILFVLVVLMSIMGILAATGALTVPE
ncbi:MAG: hypothetical protein IPP55_12520 [Anaerolineales bacterium]|nr:hypothetical protein [Anaerolineales bacterium]MBK9780853.1 hypothetical protein [Anaerolineales bacterium]